MIVSVNGSPRELPTDATVATAVELMTDAPQGRGVAVAVGGEVVPRGAWENTMLTDGAAVEIVVAVQGG
ncbi:MAG TPA: sulfur carrier protein ThiS [Solirubrobacteraceae bacterium]